jgi:hypothetical protein
VLEVYRRNPRHPPIDGRKASAMQHIPACRLWARSIGAHEPTYCVISSIIFLTHGTLAP